MVLKLDKGLCCMCFFSFFWPWLCTKHNTCLPLAEELNKERYVFNWGWGWAGAPEGRVISKYFKLQIKEGQTYFIRNRGRVAVFFDKEKITPCRLVVFVSKHAKCIETRSPSHGASISHISFIVLPLYSHCTPASAVPFALFQSPLSSSLCTFLSGQGAKHTLL